MRGGLMQLVAYGAQDWSISNGNPQDAFKVVYSMTTLTSSMEAIEQILTGTAAFGSSVTAKFQVAMI